MLKILLLISTTVISLSARADVQFVCHGGTAAKPFELVIRNNIYAVSLDSVTGLPKNEGLTYSTYKREDKEAQISVWGYRLTNPIFHMGLYAKVELGKGVNPSYVTFGEDTFSNVKWAPQQPLKCTQH